MTRLVVDIDGCIADLASEVLRRINKEYNLSLSTTNLDRYEFRAQFQRKYNIKPEWVDKMFKNEWMWAAVLPYEENIFYLRKWASEGHEIHIVTGRHKESSIVTRGWLRRYDVPFNSYTHWDVMKKYKYMEKINADFIIEDRFPEAYKCAAFGFKAYVVKRPWNEKYVERSINEKVKFVNKFEDVDKYEFSKENNKS